MSELDDLTLLAIKYGTDKWGKHNYTPAYYDLFKDSKQWVRKVLEIGVAEGAGVRMFRDFFPKAMIYGAEIEEKRVIHEERIEVFECDQSKPDDLIKLLSNTGFDLDIVIDDGSHKPKDQIITALTILPLLKKESLYIIEDVADKSIERAFDDYDYKWIECGDRYDDRLLVIRHKQ